MSAPKSHRTGTSRKPRSKRQSAKIPTDKVLAQAQGSAQEAAVELAGQERVGEHVRFVMDDERLGTHYFACTDSGYRGWYWSVTLARAPRARTATLCEVALLPGEDALLAPRWVPWAERLRPGDLGPNDVLPYIAGDDRLIEQVEADDDAADSPESDDSGLGRTRVLSPQGRAAAAERWYAGEFGPNSATARRATAQCSSCGFLLKLAGSARTMFGVCANEWSPADGHVVSLDHGCGAHSETDVPQLRSEWEQSAPVIDELDLEIISRTV